ncbi:MAG TPA: hypothetical protein VKH81_22800 [Candidatus Angelobacter sp.]|nr:hypothetical protein [Candidatus Angelobacter sp.]
MRHYVNSIKNNFFFILLSAVALIGLPARSYSQSACINQSPRNVLYQPPIGAPPAPGLDYNYKSTAPVVTFGADPTTVNYQGRVLHVCDQHYHVPVENVQGCTNEKQGVPPPHGTPPPVGQWIEVHTVYAAEVDNSPECAGAPDRNLACCKKPPFVVRGFSARVAQPSGSSAPPIPQPATGLLVEWSGSNTSPDDNTGCKPLPAQWSFRLGCQFEVRQNLLDPHRFEAHGARPVQPPNRVSPDMTLVGDARELDNKACRPVRTTPIASDAIAKQWGCPVACKPPLSSFNGDWRNVPDNLTPQYALCTCCAPDRPQ